MALSLGSPPVAVSNCLVLRCPDFPLTLPNMLERKRSSSALPTRIIALLRELYETLRYLKFLGWQFGRFALLLLLI